MPLCMTPPDLASKADTASPLTRTGPDSAGGKNSGLRPASEEYFQLRKTRRSFVRRWDFGFRRSMRILFDRHSVVHLVDAHDLGVAAVAAQLVIFAHDERFDRLGGTHLGAQSAEAAAREVEVEIIENLDLLAGLAVTAEGDQVIRTGLRALVARNA